MTSSNDVQQRVDIFLAFPVHPVTPAPRLVSISHSPTCHTARSSATGLSNLREYKKRVSINITQILHGVQFIAP